jgi:hypothetical protein
MKSQADLHVPTHRRFVEAAGATVEIRVTIQRHSPVKLKGFAELEALS